MQAYGGGTANYTKTVIYRNTNAKAQQFKVQFNKKTGYYTIMSLQGNKYLDLKGNKAVNSGIVMVNRLIPSCGQNWLFLKNSDGTYTIASGCNKNYVLDVKASSVANNTVVQLYKKTGAKAQKFKVIDTKTNAANLPKHPNQTVDDGTYTITSTINNTSSLQALNGGTANYTRLVLYRNSNNSTQQFKIKFNQSTGYYSIVTVKGGKYLDVKSNRAANGGIVMVNRLIVSCGQNWLIKKNSNGSYTIASGCNQNYVLDVSGSKTVNNTVIQLYKTNNSKAQQFKLVKN